MFAIFTGTKKGIWHGILALECVTVVLTARDEKIGSITVSLLVKYGLGNVFLYQLDVQDQCSVVSLAKYVKIQFGRLDILSPTSPSTYRFFRILQWLALLYFLLMLLI
ncbi:hypothetical protein MKW92_028382 [Papaver armeniacum]|nr:hypothetical protein MKW92_028382 [Papaver armeniacum]